MTDRAAEAPPSRRPGWLPILTALVIIAVIVSLFGGGVNRPSSSLHLTQAAFWASDSAQWTPPDTLAASDDAVLNGAQTWSDVALPHARSREVVADAAHSPGQPQVAWYRMPVPAEALTDAGQGTRLYIPRWQTVGTVAVYLDGGLLWQTRGSRVWNSFNRPVWLDLSSRRASALAGRDATLHVRMASEPGVGGALSTVWVGPADELRPDWRIRSALQTELIAVSQGSYLVLGVFALVLWLLRPGRGEQVYALFFLMAISHVLAALQFLVDDEGISVSDDWFSWLTQLGLMGTSVCSFFFLCLVQRQRRQWLASVLLAYTGAIVVLALPLWGVGHEGMLPLLRLALLPPEILVLVVAVRGAWRQRTLGDVLLAAWVALSFPVGIHDLALQSYRVSIEGIYLTPYVYVGMFTLFLVIAFTRYNGALDSAGNANAHLAERLLAQERELAQTHERLLVAEREQTLLQERQRLMREMHDGVGSSLMTALRLVEHGDASTLNMTQVLKECIDDLKISIDSLEPLDHDLLALLASLRYRLAPRLEGAGLQLEWRVRDLPELSWLDAQSALHVLRILQEVFTNIIKHSGAQRISLETRELARDGVSGVQVEVQDDGRRFIPSNDPIPGRKGLHNVRVRAKVLHAQVFWQGLTERSECGNRFTLWLPISRED
ncbi:histidine kinase [Diaphorobacter sp. HDW4A]|uniref:sensor histidine kinase n=1 Tax=Diaphorobacter sp. HDW4A TaxID=2714924 RepID=UPI00140C5A85|nr:histidine kinase [Diaphorobacter sp. HDW4A]QIL82223.1 histidine kinase [Diaphorobacter sp. HDW4A]